MRHGLAGRQLGRNSGHRRALLKNLAISLVEHERIETTVAKAKELRRVADRLITWGKTGDLPARRMAQAVLQRHGLVTKLFDELAPRVSDRPGGYTRIIKTRRRVGDGAPMAIVELVGAKPPAPRQRRADRTEESSESPKPVTAEAKTQAKK